MRQRQCHRPADPRRRRLAQFAKNIVLMPLPPYAPELNSVEPIWDYLRSNFLSHCVWDTYEAILDACCDAWNALIAKSEVIASIGTRDWAQVKI